MPAVALELVNAPEVLMPMPLMVKALVLVKVLPFRSSTAPSATVIAPAEAPKAVVLPALSTPALMLVPPE